MSKLESKVEKAKQQLRQEALNYADAKTKGVIQREIAGACLQAAARDYAMAVLEDDEFPDD